MAPTTPQYTKETLLQLSPYVPPPRRELPYDELPTVSDMTTHAQLCAALLTLDAMSDPIYAFALLHSYVEIKIARGKPFYLIHRKLCQVEVHEDIGLYFAPVFEKIRAYFGFDPSLPQAGGLQSLPPRPPPKPTTSSSRKLDSPSLTNRPPMMQRASVRLSLALKRTASTMSNNRGGLTYLTSVSSFTSSASLPSLQTPPPQYMPRTPPRPPRHGRAADRSDPDSPLVVPPRKPSNHLYSMPAASMSRIAGDPFSKEMNTASLTAVPRPQPRVDTHIRKESGPDFSMPSPSWAPSAPSPLSAASAPARMHAPATPTRHAVPASTSAVSLSQHPFLVSQTAYLPQSPQRRPSTASMTDVAWEPMASVTRKPSNGGMGETPIVW